MGTSTGRRSWFVAAFFVGLVVTFLCSGLAGTSSPPPDEGRPPLVSGDADTEVWSCLLRAGENFVALPLLPYDDTWEGLLGRLRDVLTEAAVYDPVDGRWVRYLPSSPGLSDRDDRVPSLILRLVTRAEATLYVEGRRFTGETARLVPLKDRITVPGGWSFLGACWDSSEASDCASPSQFETRLSGLDFRLGTDCLLRWNGSTGAWTRVLSTADLPNPIPRGSVFVACRLSDGATDPYTPASSRGGSGQSGVQQGGLSYMASLSGVDFYSETAADEFGSSLGDVTLTAHSYKKTSDGKPEKGSAWVNLPEAFRGFTDLPQRVWGTVHYTTEEPPRIQRVSLANVHTVVVGPGTEDEQRVEDIDEIFVTADGLIYGTGWLRGVPAEGSSSANVDFRVQIVWNKEWPTKNPSSGASEKKNALEIERVLGAGSVAALRWTKSGSTVTAFDGWRVYLAGTVGSKFTMVQDPACDVANGARARVAWHEGEIAGSKEVHWVADHIVKASALTATFGADLISAEDGAVLEAYDTGLVRFKLSDGWWANLYGDYVDFETHNEADTFSLHLMYSLATGTAPGGGSVFRAEAGVGIFVDGHDFDSTGVRIKHLTAGVQLKGNVDFALSRQGGESAYGTFRRSVGNLMLPGSSPGPSGFRGLVNWDAMKYTATGGAEPMRHLDNTSVGLSIKGLAQLSWGDRAREVTALLQYDVGKYYKAAPNKWFKRQKITFQASYDEIDPGAEAEDASCMMPTFSEGAVRSAGVKVERSTDENPRLPDTKLVVSLFGDFNLPSTWGMAGQDPVLSGLFTFTKEYWNADRAKLAVKGDVAYDHYRAEFSLMSNFTFHLAGGSGIQLPDAEGVQYPNFESGLSIDLFRLTFDYENARNLARKELTLTLSGVGQQRRATGDGSTFEDKTISFFAFGSKAWGPALGTGKGILDDLSFLVALDFDWPLVDGDVCRMDKIFLARMDGVWSGGLGLRVRAKKAYDWGSVALLPVYGSSTDWSVTAELRDLQLSDDFTLKNAFVMIGKTAGAWNNCFGGAVAFEDMGPLDQMKVELGALVHWTGGEGGGPTVSLYAKDTSGEPQFGDESLGLSINYLGGTMAWKKVSGKLQLDQMSLTGRLAGYLPWLRHDDDETAPPAVGLTLNYTKKFNQPASSSTTTTGTPRSWTFGMVADTHSLINFNFDKDRTKPIEEAGGFVWNSLEMAYGNQGFDWAGSATLYTPKLWRDTLGGFAGGSGVSLPESATASFRTINGLRGPKEISLAFNPAVGVKIGDVATLGINSFYYRKASPWGAKAGAVLECGQGDSRRTVAGTIGRSQSDGAFEFAPTLDEPLILEFDDWTFTISSFLLRITPKLKPDDPITVTIRGAASITTPDGKTVTGNIVFMIGTDKSIAIGLTNVTGVDALGLDSASVSISISKNPEGSAKKWSVGLAIGAIFELPEEVPLLGGKKFMGCIQGDTSGEFGFAVTGMAPTDDTSGPVILPTGAILDVPIMPYPFPTPLDGMGKLALQSISFGKRIPPSGGAPAWYFSCQSQLTLYQPMNQIFGKQGDEPLVLPACNVGYENGNVFIETRIQTPPGFGIEFGLGDLGRVNMQLTRLYLNTQPAVGAAGSFSLQGGKIHFALDFGINYMPPTQISFLLNFTDQLEFGVPGLFSLRLKRAGFTSLLPGLMGIDADFGIEVGNMFYGFGVDVQDLWWISPSTVPPVGFPFFDKLTMKLSFLGFTAQGAIALPRPRIPSPFLIIEFFKKLTYGFRDHAWYDLKVWLGEHKEEFEAIFKGPGVGDIAMLLPYLLKPALPDLEVVEEELLFIGKIPRLKLPLLSKMYFATDVMEMVGLSWPEGLVRMLQVVDALIMVCKGELGRVIEFVPEEKRAGDVSFNVEGFVKFNIGYRFVPDEIIYATEQVPGVFEFNRFNRLANYLEETYPTLASLSSKEKSPVVTDFAFVDREGETFSGKVKDTFVNLKDTMAAAVELRKRLDINEVEFNERLAFRKHLDYLTKDNAAVFTPSPRPGPPQLLAKISSTRTSTLQLMGLTEPVTFRNEDTGDVYMKDRPLALYATTSMARMKDGGAVGALAGFDATADEEQMGKLLEEEQKRRLEQVQGLSAEEQRLLREAAARLAEANLAQSRVRAKEAEIAEKKKKADASRMATEAWYAGEVVRIHGAMIKVQSSQPRFSLSNIAEFVAALERIKTETARLRSELGAMEAEHRRRVIEDQKLFVEVRNLEVALHALRDRAVALQAVADKAQAAAQAAGRRRQDAEGAATALKNELAKVDVVVVQPYVIERGRKLYAAFDATVRDLLTQRVVYRGTIPEQFLYDIEKGTFSNKAPVVGWLVSHALDDKDLGRATFSDYGTMKIEAPLTVITYQFKGSKLNKVRDTLEYLGSLPVFDGDSTPFLLSNKFWYNLEQGDPPPAARSIQGRSVKVVYDKSAIRSADRGTALNAQGEGDEEESTLDVVLNLDDVRYGSADDEGAGNADEGMKLSVRSDIKRFYRLDKKLFAQPFEVAYATSGGHDHVDDANAPPATETVSDLIVLDGSEDVGQLFQARDAARKARIDTLFDVYDQLGLNWNYQQMKIKQVTVECHDSYLLTLVRPHLVSITNIQHGAEILHLDAGGSDVLEKLMTSGPYGDPATYPSREKTWYVECRGFTGDTKATTDRDEDLVSLFEADLLLREVDLQAPKGLLGGDIWQGARMWDHLEARFDGMWKTGLKIPGSTLPDGITKLMQEGESVVAHLRAPSGKPIQIRRRFGGSVEVVVEREPGNWVNASFARDERDRITGGIKYPTGEVIPGGFFVYGLLKLGNSQILSGQIDFNGDIRTDGGFHFEGGCDIYVLGKDVASGRFIIDRQDGLYVMGRIDAGIARVFIEGRLKSDYFSLTGELDVRLGGLLGVKASVTVNPSMFQMRGDVFMAGKKVFHGLIRITGSSFEFVWAVSCGRVGADASVKFTSTKDGNGNVTSWSLRVGGKVWVKLWWPFGRPSLSFGFSIDSQGNFRVYFWRIYVQVNIVSFRVSWGWD